MGCAGSAALVAALAVGCSTSTPDKSVGDPPTDAPTNEPRSMFVVTGASGSATSTGGMEYALTLSEPSSSVSAYEGRPLKSASKLSLADWVDGWDSEHGFAEKAPTAVLQFTDEDGNARSIAAQIKNPSIDDAGALRFDMTLQAQEPGVAPVYPQAVLNDVTLVVDDEGALFEGGDSRGLFVFSGETGQLSAGPDESCPTHFTLTTVPSVFAIAQTPTHTIASQELESFVQQWARRGFVGTPPYVALSTGSDTAAGSSVVRLTDPVMVAGDSVRFCVHSVGDAAVSSGDSSGAWFADLAVTGGGAATVIIGSAQMHPSMECFSNADCTGSAHCESVSAASQGDKGGFNICTFLACTEDSDCSPVEYCAPWSSSGGESGKVCFPDETCSGDSGVSDAAKVCAAPATCVADRCTPIGCDTDAECAPATQSSGAKVVSEGLCIDHVCQLSPHPYDGLYSQQGVLYGTTWSSPQLNTACMAQRGAPLAELCTIYEIGLEDRVLNLLGMLSSVTNSDFSYYGRNWFNAIDERGALSPASNKAGSVGTYAFPSADLQDVIFAPFGMIDTAFVNFTSRLSGDITNEHPFRYPFSDADAAVPTDTVDFLTPYFGDYAIAVEKWPANNILSGGSEIELVTQFGGGGGYGCYFGVIERTGSAADGDENYIAKSPMLQVGGGFGFGLSESTGLDFGLGGGISFCKNGDCSRQIGQFYGGGGGINWRLEHSEEPATNHDSQSKDGFADLLNGEGTTTLDNEDYFYLYCGSGGGLGFQARPTAGSSPTSRYFTPIWDLGGGGNSWVIFKRVADDDAGKSNPLSDPELASAHAGFSSDVISFLDSGRGDALVLPGDGIVTRTWNAQRGVIFANGDMKTGVVGSQIANGSYGFTYEPYHFSWASPDVPFDARAADIVYMPGSNATAALYYSEAGRTDVDDAKWLEELKIEKAIYALNTNPLFFDYEKAGAKSGSEYKYQWSDVRDINADAITLLSGVEHGGSATDVVLTVPIYVQHTTSNESTVPPMVSQNKWALDEAVALAKANPNITSIMLGAGGHGVVQAFDPSCNSYTYSQYSPPPPQQGIMVGSKNSVNCTRYESSLEFVDYYTLLDYVSALIAGDKKGGPKSDQDLKFTRDITIGINQRLDLPNPDGTFTPASTDGKDEVRLGWLTPTTVKQNGQSNAGASHSLIDYWELTESSDKTTWTAVAEKYLYDIELPSNVTLKAMFSADIVQWAALHSTTLSGSVNAPIGELSPLTALQASLDRVKTDTLGGAAGLFADSILQTGWFGEDPISGGSDLVAGMEFIAATIAQYPDLALELYFDQAFDQPWKSLPALLPGMPDSVCGHTFSLPHLVSDNPAGPPLPGNLPTECAPDFYGTPIPGMQPHPTCLCLTNITNYPVTFAPFISDVTELPESGPNLVVPPNSVVTWERGSNPAKFDPNTDGPADESKAAGFYDAAVANKDGAFNVAAQWKQWPEQLVGGCKLWDGTSCAKNASGGEAALGDEVPAATTGEALPSLRCVGVSDVQNGAGSANAGFQCPQVWFQYYCEGAAPCTTPLRKDYSFPWGKDWQGNQIAFTWTANDPWDLECKPQGGGAALQPVVTTVSRIDPAVAEVVDDKKTKCMRVQWTAKGSAYDEVSGWMLKTLEPPQPPPGSTIRRLTPASPKIGRESLTFELAPMTIITQQEQTTNSSTHEVSAEYTFCPVPDPTTDSSSSNQFFPAGLTKGQYWFRIQPMGGIAGDGASVRYLPSVDAIDMEFDPICNENAGTTAFTHVGKFTINYPMPDISTPLPLDGLYSKVEKVVFKLPDLDGGKVKGTSFTITPPVDNGVADFSLPGQSPNCTDAAKCPAITTTMEVHFTVPVKGTDPKTKKAFDFGPDKPCVIELQVTAGKDGGNQGGQAKLPTAAEAPADGCFLELGDAKLFVNGANFDFCDDPTADLCAGLAP